MAASRIGGFSPWDPLHLSMVSFVLSAIGLCFGFRRTPAGPPPCIDPRAVIIGDVHGCARELRTLLRRVKLRPSCDALYFTGDLIGKGPDSIAVLREVRALSLSDLQVEAVMGNHEAGFLRWLDEHGHQRSPQPGTKERETWATTLGSDELLWLRERPLHVALPPEFGSLRVVHAGMQPGVTVGEQTRENMLTIRSLLRNGTGTSLPGSGASWAAAWTGPEHLIFGHDARRKIQRHAHATGLDSGAVYGGKLTALILHHRMAALNTTSAGASPGEKPVSPEERAAATPSVVVPSATRGGCGTRAPCLMHVSSQRSSCGKPKAERRAERRAHPTNRGDTLPQSKAESRAEQRAAKKRHKAEHKAAEHKAAAHKAAEHKAATHKAAAHKAAEHKAERKAERKAEHRAERKQRSPSEGKHKGEHQGERKGGRKGRPKERDRAERHDERRAAHRRRRVGEQHGEQHVVEEERADA